LTLLNLDGVADFGADGPNLLKTETALPLIGWLRYNFFVISGSLYPRDAFLGLVLIRSHVVAPSHGTRPELYVHALSATLHRWLDPQNQPNPDMSRALKPR
jgi:hypothetical protein